MNSFLFFYIKNRNIIAKSVVVFSILLLTYILFKTMNDTSFAEKIANDYRVIISIGVVSLSTSLISILPNYLNNQTKKDDSAYLLEIEQLQEKLNSINDIRLKEKSPEPYEIIQITLNPLIGNIKNHIGNLQRNSTVNLLIGILGTIATISILSFNLLSTHVYNDLSIFVINFLPKISFVIIIQLFAFFFLRLYKGNLEDSKYFQNELTNIMAKTVAIKLAHQLEDKPLTSKLVNDLSKVERNFKLAAGESLLNIEKSKIEKDFDLELLRNIKNLLNIQKQKSK